MNIIEQLRKELKDNLVITHKVTEMYLGNAQNQIEAGSFDEINIDEEFKVKFIIENKNTIPLILTHLFVFETKYAAVIGSHSDTRDLLLHPGGIAESKEFILRAKERIPKPQWPEPIARVKIWTEADPHKLLRITKEDIEYERIEERVPELN